MRAIRVSLSMLPLAALLAACTAGPVDRPAAPAGTSAPPAAAAAGTPGGPAPAGPESGRGGSAAATTPAPSAAAAAAAWPTGPRSTPETDPVAHLVAVRTARHASFDRVVFEFRGRVPGYDVRYVPAVTQDASGRPVPLRGSAFLRVVLRHASAVEQGLPAPPGYRRTWTGPSTVTTGFASLQQVRAAGDFEGYLSFGVGLGRRAGFRVLTLTGPPRVVLDVAGQGAAARPFPGIWDIRTWEQARAVQRAVDAGHQPWRTSPARLVRLYAQQVLGIAEPVVAAAAPDTFTVARPGAGTVATVRVAQPLARGPGGIWVVTRVVRHVS
ncbi:MAG TPA: hypothetical protein VKG45_15900 [Actinomycetes bacterium]|nr:hypothetical protein [Actinomycetes bacterium]